MSDPLSDTAVIVFDGVCVLCNRSLYFVLAHDRRQYFRFATMQSASGRALLSEHGLDPDDPASFLLVENGRGYTASDAWIRILVKFGGVWRLLGGLYLLPRMLRDPVYYWIAGNRYRWFGRYDACPLPAPELLQRFID